MKKLALGALFVGLASMAQAAFITCTPSQGTVVNDGAPSSQVFTCSPGAENVNDGILLQSLQIVMTGSAQQNAINPSLAGTVFGVQFSPTTGGSPVAPVGCLATSAANNLGQATQICSGDTGVVNIAGLGLDFIPTFTVTVAGQTSGALPLYFNASWGSCEGKTSPRCWPIFVTHEMNNGLLLLCSSRKSPER